MRRWLRAVVVLAFIPATARPQSAGRPVIVASKPFGESYILAEMFAQLLEARGMRADRRLGLGATQIAYGALRTGAIDVYPEYTGTGLIAILGATAATGCARGLLRGRGRVRCARQRPMASAAGLREHLRHRGATKHGRLPAPQHAE